MIEYWRWNVNAAWENFCAMYEDAHLALEASHEFDRYKNLRSCLNFSSIALEAFINEQMRRHLQNISTPEEKIYKYLRRENLKNKINNWPNEFGTREIELDPGHTELYGLFDHLYDLRNGLVHPKERDHTIYRRLDGLNPMDVVQAVSTTIVRISESIPQPFPYWTLGWNFVGLNFKDTHPVLLGISQFRHSLAHLGLISQNNAWLYDDANKWTGENMQSLSQFKMLKSKLESQPHIIEPWFEIIKGMGAPPRLTKRWWDHELIVSSIPGMVR